ncbi:MAG: AmmeMemoRadiSam system radical SAM enzyme [Halanaerobiales bacterium]
MKKARYYKKLKNHKVQCNLCPHYCVIEKGDTGICRGRENRGGELYSKNYGKISSAGVDPIEKKPLYHFCPDEDILSIGTFGCNFSCDFCQNWRISQKNPELRELTPEQVVELALEKNTIGIAYTYSEPLVWYEFVYETSKLACENNLKNVLVTNGYINSEPLEKLLPYIHGANVDLKAFTSEFYKKYAGGHLEPVLNTIKIMYKKIHVELTNLLITDTNDDEKELENLFSWIADINPAIPLHLSRYFPNYNFDKPATSVELMEKSFQQAREKLDFVYLGNIRSDTGNNTICPQCGKTLIKRKGYSTVSFLNNRNCPRCGYEIYGKFNC